MRPVIILLCVLIMAPSLSHALQSLDVPETPTFDDRLPRKEKQDPPVELTFEKTITIEQKKSNLVICSEGAASGENLESALEACNAAIDEAPENGEAYYYRGFVLFHLERYADAERDFTMAIDYGANHLAESYYQRGACKEQQRRLREAAADFKKAHDLKPDWYPAKRKVEEYHWAYK